MMKKGVIFCLIVAILSSLLNGVVIASSERITDSFEIFPQSCSVDSDKAVSRGEFAYTISRILGSGSLEKSATEYTDVSEGHLYSGYIRYATGNGFLIPMGNAFCPEDAISLHDFNKAVVKLLSYERISEANGGGQAGDLKTVMDLQLYRGISIENYDSVSVTQYRKLIYNLLTAKINDFSYSYDETGAVSLNKNGSFKTILSEYFRISRYRGNIIGINPVKPAAQVRISANVTTGNPVYLPEGHIYTFLAGSKIDLNFYENIPVEIWVDENKQIVHIALQNNVEVFYDVIYSVNNDTSSNAFDIRYLHKIEFSGRNKLYQVASGCQLRYNGNNVTRPFVFSEKYARVTVIDNKVAALDIWELTDGGLITGVTNDYFTYHKGEGNSRMSNLSSYNRMIVIIDGVSTDRSQLKANSVFSYYKDGTDTLVVVASEKMVIGSFDSMGNDEMEIGLYFYEHDSEVYFSQDKTTYRRNEYEPLFGCDVAAYLDCFGNVKYVTVRSGEGASDNQFYAYLIGTSQKGFGKKEFKVQIISPIVEEKIYPLSERVIYEDGLSEATLLPATKANAGHHIYQFELNSKGEIKTISKASHWMLFGDSLPAVDCSFPLFENEATANIYIYAVADAQGNYTLCLPNTSGRTTLRTYLYQPRYVAVYEEDGKIAAREVTWNDLLCKISTDVKIAIFADEEAFTPELVLIYGNTENIAHYTITQSAVVTGVSRCYHPEKDEEYAQVSLLSSSGTEKLSLSLDTAATLSENMYLTYRPGALFTEDGIMIENKTVLPADFSQWESIMGYYPGNVKKISKERVFMQDGKAYQLRPNVTVFGVDTTGGRLRFKNISFEEIEEGDRVLCSSNSGVSLIFVDITGR